MNNPKTEEIVESLRGCVLNDEGSCDKCVVTGGMACGCSAELMLIAADLIEQLQLELIDERYRHDRLQDFCVAQGEELSKIKAQQRWIPVTERLPEFAEDVHVVDAIGDVEKGMYIGDDTWLLEGGTLSTPYVRWWKAFPEPPKE